MGTAKRAVLPDGSKAASRSVYDVPARVQEVEPYTVSRLYVSDAKPPKRKTVRP
jgi:hypothetical protein